ncbi:MAG: S41 family peptidase [Oscillospiraceae bacterium]|jgi:carboxyl-terminal processing protease|nr:S41 family peptidase [Oscillospiraceae bacterium]
MKKRVNIITAVVLMALTGLVTYIVTFSFVRLNLNQQLEEFSKQRQELGSFYTALSHLENNFIGEVDKQVLIQGAIDGMVKNTGDKWSRYYDPEAFRAYLESQGNQYIGVGIRVEPDGEEGIRIVEVMASSPAEEAALRTGDVITHVNGMAVADTGYNGAVASISGDAYTSVTLTVSRPSEGGGSFTVDLMRRTVTRERVMAGILQTAGGKVGVIRITSFDDRVDDEFIEKIGGLLEENVDGLIFDVRDNPGGKLNVLERILDYLLPEGELATLRYKDGSVDIRTSGPECIELPMAVLMDKNSVSAAELFAASLHEYEWAVLIGEKTGGKGYAQEYFRLSDGSGLYLSTREYFTSKGVSLADSGLMPDVEVVLSEEERQYISTMDPTLDRQLQRALLELNYR